MGVNGAKQLKRTFLSSVLALVLVVGLAPTTAFAEDNSVEQLKTPASSEATEDQEQNSGSPLADSDKALAGDQTEVSSDDLQDGKDFVDEEGADTPATAETATIDPLAEQTVLEPSETDEAQVTVQSAAAEATILGRAHVQNIGWQNWARQNSIFGTTGRSKRVEALELKIDSNGYKDSSIVYQAHVQSIGWQDDVKDGALSGTTGRSLRVEAVRISLTGSITSDYDVYYRVHVSNIGWMGWTKNGESAGTQGMSARAEAYEVRLVEKGQPAPVNNGATQSAFLVGTGFSAEGHVQSIGNMSTSGNGGIIGTTGRGLRLEAFKLNLNSSVGAINYQAHVQNIGWQEWKSNGQLAGTTGQAKRVEAVKINLSGSVANQYDVYYRVHIAEYGWLDWACNGKEAGSEGFGLRVEALQVKIVPKGASAPGSTYRPALHTYKVSSNAELNRRISNIIETKTGTNLRKCFEYSMTFKYRTKGVYPSYDKWTEDYALDLLKTGYGNCYSYSCLFYYLAKACGFDGTVVSGQITQSNGKITPHGWVELNYYGTTYVCDPDLEKELSYNGYLITYGNAPLKYIKLS